MGGAVTEEENGGIRYSGSIAQYNDIKRGGNGMNTLKTWEMIRNIREGGTYEIASGEYEGSGVSLTTGEYGASGTLTWTERDDIVEECDLDFRITAVTMSYEWRKREEDAI
jgi:hypothetical protein